MLTGLAAAALAVGAVAPAAASQPGQQAAVEAAPRPGQQAAVEPAPQAGPRAAVEPAPEQGQQAGPQQDAAEHRAAAEDVATATGDRGDAPYQAASYAARGAAVVASDATAPGRSPSAPAQRVGTRPTAALGQRAPPPA